MQPFYLIGVIVMLSGIALTQYNILIGVMIAILGIAINLMYIMIRPKYPVRAMIFMKRQGNYRIVWDKAARLETDKKTGTYKYRFQKIKDETKAARFENLYPSGGGEIAIFYSPAPGEYYQANMREGVVDKDRKIEWLNPETNKIETKTITVQEAEIKPIPDELVEWFVLMAQRAKQRYEKISTWEKYYPFVVAAVMIVLLGITIAVTFSGMKPVAESWEKAGASFDGAAAKIAAAVERLDAMEKGEQIVNNNVPIQTSDLPPPPDVG